MKLTPKASLGFKKEKPAAKTGFGANVIASLTPLVPTAKATANAYSDLPVPVTELQQLNTDLANAVADSLTGNHSAVASVKNAVIAWNYGFGLTANYITTIAEGDAQTIRKAGFVPTKSDRQPKPKPGAAIDFKATINGSKGAIIAGAKTAVPGATAYVFAVAPDDAVITYVGNTMVITIGEKSIYITADTRKQTELYDLPSGLPVNVSMYAINGAGSGPASAPQQVIPQ